MKNKTLVEILKHHKWDCDKDPHCGNKIFPGHTYLEVYDRLFNVFQHELINILEIGILRGTSLKLWSEYFTKATIYGADTFERIDWPGCKFEEVQDTLKSYSNIKLVQVNSCSDNLVQKIERESFLDSIPDGFFHIIIDDGSHELIDQINTYRNFKSKLNTEGVYVVEDIGITNGQPIDPQELIKEVPDLKLLDMRYPSKHDNALAIHYSQKSKNSEHFESYYNSKHWKTAPEFQLDYILNKQKEI